MWSADDTSKQRTVRIFLPSLKVTLLGPGAFLGVVSGPVAWSRGEGQADGHVAGSLGTANGNRYFAFVF